MERDEKKAKYYCDLAAIKGDVHARHNIGCVEGEAGNEHRAMKHFLLAAKAGYTKSLDSVKIGFINGSVSKDDYSSALREYQKSTDEMKSDAREAVAEILAQRGMT